MGKWQNPSTVVCEVVGPPSTCLDSFVVESPSRDSVGPGLPPFKSFRCWWAGPTSFSSLFLFFFFFFLSFGSMYSTNEVRLANRLQQRSWNLQAPNRMEGSILAPLESLASLHQPILLVLISSYISMGNDV